MDYFINNIMYIALILTFLITLFVFRKYLFIPNWYNKIVDSASGHKKISKDELAITLLAYERLTVFLERLEPIGMFNRLDLHNLEKDVARSMLIKNIVIEYEYNVSQQIYVSDELWEIINVVKNKIINSVSKAFDSLPKKANANDFFNIMLKQSKHNTLILNHAKKALKKERRLIS
mgnify:FL=1